MFWIVQRELILQAPGEHRNRQPNKNEGESTKARAKCVRDLHEILGVKSNIAKRETPATEFDTCSSPLVA
jgi:hypothetical protein